jgi:ferric-dicitrate binding protein FerR (iron transport regulator)
MENSLLERFFLNEVTLLERKQIVSWLLNPDNDTSVRLWMMEHWDLVSHSKFNSNVAEPDAEALWLNIQQKIKQESISQQGVEKPFRTFHFHIRQWMAVAAVLLVMLVAAYYFWQPLQQKSLSSTLVKTDTLEGDVAPPDANIAILTLADGTKIYLDSMGNGTLAQQDGIAITKQDDGQIVYSGNASDGVAFNTLSLPKGSKPFRITLSDGSNVWLNAASSITYPTAFSGKERKVNMIGEAYFEVAKNDTKPFIVTNNQMSIKVLGTHFNVNTYEDEQTGKVTLLEGLVVVEQGNKTKGLTPGQQALVMGEKIKVIEGIDTEEVMAWKNGLFYFNGADINAIMRQIEKYYDVEVEYHDDVNYLFVAKISRQVNVSEFLKILELTNLIHFKIEGRKIIVTK